MISDPQTQLLCRWKRIAEYISRARLSCDAVIMLNRSLDLAEEMVPQTAPTDKDRSNVEKAKGSEVLRPFFSDDINARTNGELASSLPNASACRTERIGWRDPKEYEHVLDRVTKAVDLLRIRQQDMKVSVFILHGTEGLPRQHAYIFMSAPPSNDDDQNREPGRRNQAIQFACKQSVSCALFLLDVRIENS